MRIKDSKAKQFISIRLGRWEETPDIVGEEGRGPPGGEGSGKTVHI